MNSLKTMNRMRFLENVGVTLTTLTALWGALTSAKADDTAIARDWVAAWNSHDADAVAAVFTSDAFYEDLPFGLKVHGTAEIHDFAQFFLTVVPDLHVEYLDSTIKGGHGTIEWIFSGTDKGIYSTGKTFSVRGVTVIEVHGGKISRNSDVYDLATILRELGLLSAGL